MLFALDSTTFFFKRLFTIASQEERDSEETNRQTNKLFACLRFTRGFGRQNADRRKALQGEVLYFFSRIWERKNLPPRFFFSSSFDFPISDARSDKTAGNKGIFPSPFLFDFVKKTHTDTGIEKFLAPPKNCLRHCELSIFFEGGGNFGEVQKIPHFAPCLYST